MVFIFQSHCEVWWIAESVLNMSRSRNIFTSETEEILLKLNFIVVSHNKIKITIFFINNMSSTVLISCRMKIGLYLLNCHPLNPSILQMMSFVNSTCLKISKIIFCFITIRWKNEGNIFTSLKDLTASNAQFRDQNCCSSLRKLLIVF